MSLYNNERPTKFTQLVGQDSTVAALKASFKSIATAPHVLLLVGPSGVGKTTTARILRKRLKCHDSCYHEVNAADNRGIEDIRRIRSQMTRAPLGGKCHIWVIDECHQLTKDAQNAMLKMLEDTPSSVYFILCTTDPQKLLKTIVTRCTQFKFQSVKPLALIELVNRVAAKHEIELEEEIAEKIAEVADGSPRKALVSLEQVWKLSDVDEQMEVLGRLEEDTVTLCKMLLNPRAQWADYKKVLKDIKERKEDAEGIRRWILAWCSGVMLGKGNSGGRAYKVSVIFSENFYDTGMSGLVRNCWEVVHDMD